MKVKEKEAQIERIANKLRKSAMKTYAGPQAEQIFKVISRVTHFQEKGEQRHTKKSRREIDAQVIANVGEALRVL